MAELPILSRTLLRADAAVLYGASMPDPALLELPETVVQFGTGALLRGFVEYFIDAANRSGRFAGRIVAVESTGSGRASLLNRQDGLYTLVVQGTEGGAPVRDARVIASLSRVVSARDQWDQVLAAARNPALELVFSNTTEAGIQLDPGDAASDAPPRSFPGKLTAFLFERARTFDYAAERAPVVIPCELVEDNGAKLREIVVTLARRWQLGAAFEQWLGHVRFCDTLVDRIVPGTPADDALAAFSAELGYRDALLTICEPYRLFAIQGDAALAARLGFTAADPGVIVAPDITPYRERKVRLLNGAHTIAAPAALLCGCTTVLDALQHPLLGRLIRRALLEDLPRVSDVPGADAFAHAVLDRFANPFVRHQLIDITLQQTTKFRVRVVPSILRHAERHGHVPAALTLGFSGLLHYLRMAPAADVALPADPAGEQVRARWRAARPVTPEAVAHVARDIAADATLWGAALHELPGFVDAVAGQLDRAAHEGFAAVLALELAAAAAQGSA